VTNLFGEFFGTMILIIFGAGVVANVLLKNSKAEGGGWLVITTGWAFAVMLGVFAAIAAGSPQADINPAVTLAKTMIGIYTVTEAIATMLAQLCGGIVGGIVVWLAFLPHWEVTEDKGAKLAVFCTAPAIRNPLANFLCEIIGTVMLIVLIFAIFSKQVGGLAPGFGPYLVGVLVWAIGLSLGGPTGYAINPARDLGPRIAHALLPIAGKGGSDWGYAWVPIVAPLVGGMLAFGIARGIGLI
jgi:glycerol uptake facilitator protein